MYPLVNIEADERKKCELASFFEETKILMELSLFKVNFNLKSVYLLKI